MRVMKGKRSPCSTYEVGSVLDNMREPFGYDAIAATIDFRFIISVTSSPKAGETPGEYLCPIRLLFAALPRLVKVGNSRLV
jgi:hypothetical protein